MTTFVVAVFDSAMQAFATPMFVPAVGVAVRSFSDEVRRKSDKNVLSMHPEDFELVELGMYDEQTGNFINGAPRVLIRGKDVPENLDYLHKGPAVPGA